MKIKNKKGIALNETAFAIIALVVVAVLVVVGLVLFSSLQTATATTLTSNANGEILTSVDINGQFLSASTLQNSICSNVVILNTTGGIITP
jgi:hypothetical protein